MKVLVWFEVAASLKDLTFEVLSTLATLGPVAAETAEHVAKHLLEVAAKLVAHCAVDERVEAAVEEAGPVRRQHREEKLRLL